MTRPVIALTSRRIPAERIDRWLEPAQALPTYYLDAIFNAGGIGFSAVCHSASSSECEAILDRFDALVVTGGLDVDPSIYGQSAHPQTGVSQLDADQWEIRLIGAARNIGMPILGICRGAQILNVALGGSLHQHIADLDGVGAHGIPDGGGGTPNPIIVEADTLLAAAIGTEGVVGRCHHHQAVDELGVGLVVSARTNDGIIEGIEVPDDPWTVAVQWHPEDSARYDPVQQNLFVALVAAAKAYHAQP